MQNLSNPQFTSKMLPGATNMPNKVIPGTPKTPLGPKTPGYTTMPNKPPSGITKPGGILNNPSVKKMNG